MRRGMCSVIVLGMFIAGVMGCGADSLGPAQGHPEISITAGDAQTGTVGKPLSQELVALVKAPDGTPAPNVAVTWTPASGSGAVTPAASTTDAQGTVRATWTLDTVAGPQHIDVSATDASPVTATATAKADAPTEFVKVSGDAQAGPFGVTLAEPIAVRLVDRYGNGVPGTGVSFAASSGSMTTTQGVSGADGVLSTRLRLPFTDATDTVVATAAVDLAPLQFTATSRSTTHLAHPTSYANAVCALSPEGYAYCWGDNCCHQLGLGSLDTTVAVLSPLPMAGGHLFTTIQIGGLAECGLDTDKLAWCWGNQDRGQTGTGAQPSHVAALEPVQVAGGHHYVALATGSAHACALTTGGGVECWGDNTLAQAGATNAGGFVLAPTAVSSPVAFSQIVAGQWFTCGLTADGSAYCWGSNQYGQLGVTSGTQPCASHADIQCATAPLPVEGGLHFSMLTTGLNHACGLTAAGQAYCWGNNAEGELGDSTQTDHATPEPIAGNLQFVAISGKDRVTCGLTAAGAIYCWGYGVSAYGGSDLTCPVRGQPGFYTGCQPMPTQLSTTLAFKTIDMGAGQLCGTPSDDILYCWGSNYQGALGDGTTQNRTAPTRVLRQP